MALPDCGLYRTGVALPGHEEQVGAEILVSFHNHSEQGPPLVLTPHANENNQWEFHERGWLVEDDGFLEALVPLKPEGFYVNRDHIHVSREEVIPERTLLQLGYNRRGDSILFLARFAGTTITFPTQGYSFRSPEVQALLERADFRVPGRRDSSDLH